jgi:drug/metabolite transporter (DMT)-like permease
LPLNLFRAVTSPVVLGGLALYAGGALLWLVILSRADLSVAYPMVSLSYVMIAVLSWLLFQEPLTITKLAGTGLILVGVYIVSRC